MTQKLELGSSALSDVAKGAFLAGPSFISDLSTGSSLAAKTWPLIASLSTNSCSGGNNGNKRDGVA